MLFLYHMIACFLRFGKKNALTVLCFLKSEAKRMSKSLVIKDIEALVSVMSKSEKFTSHVLSYANSIVPYYRKELGYDRRKYKRGKKANIIFLDAKWIKAGEK